MNAFMSFKKRRLKLSPLSLLLGEDPSLEDAGAAALELPDQRRHDVIALLLKQGKTSGAEEDLGSML